MIMVRRMGSDRQLSLSIDYCASMESRQARTRCILPLCLFRTKAAPLNTRFEILLLDDWRCLALPARRPLNGVLEGLGRSRRNCGRRSGCLSPKAANAYLGPPPSPSSSMWLAAFSTPPSLSEKARPTVAPCHCPIKSQILVLQTASLFAGPRPLLMEEALTLSVGLSFLGPTGGTWMACDGPCLDQSWIEILDVGFVVWNFELERASAVEG
ncbi:hypothetical protein V8F06_001322 [Rhypophila decipiens]